MEQDARPPELDAFGHLNWTVGNEDWIACFDAITEGDQIIYHVVVDCESGGFVDTVEDGAVSFADVSKLYQMPEYWADICREHYMDSRKRAHRIKLRETARTMKQWRAHLDALVATGPCSEDHRCLRCAECREPGPDPVQDGWIGPNGRP